VRLSSRISTLALALLNILVWTCPGYCHGSAEMPPAGVVADPIGHEHHHPGAMRTDSTNAHSIHPNHANCCGDCLVEPILASLPENYSTHPRLTELAIVALSVAGYTSINQSPGPNIPRRPPDASTAIVTVRPLRI
jgi:hypothetical protein